MMRIGHVLRKYDPEEWAGTESTLKELITEFNHLNISSSIYCPKINPNVSGPFEYLGVDVHRFSSFLPVAGLGEEQRKRLISIGGNLMSFELLRQLWKSDNLSLIHCHTLGLLGSVSQWVARKKNIPFVLSIHGGYLDLPKESLEGLVAPLKGGINWGKLFSLFLQPGKLVEKADAVFTFNPIEAERLKERYPNQKILLTPHGIHTARYRKDYRQLALEKFPHLKERELILVMGRIDPVKNQKWLIEQFPILTKKNPKLKLLFIGPCTDKTYLDELMEGQERHWVEYLGEFPHANPVLIGLLQQATLLALPSIAEPFGMVILESWAASTPVVSSSCSGPLYLIDHRKTGWLFDLDDPQSFIDAVMELTEHPNLREKIVRNSLEKVISEYDIAIVAKKIKDVYQVLIHNMT